MAANTGSVESNMTIGDHNYASGFAGAVCEEDMMRCVGWTHEEVSGVYRGWVCNVDISAISIGSPVNASDPGDDVDRTLLGDGQSVSHGDR